MYSLDKKECPCYKCDARTIYCHSTCEDYLNFKRKVCDFNKKIREQIILDKENLRAMERDYKKFNKFNK